MGSVLNMGKQLNTISIEELMYADTVTSENTKTYSMWLDENGEYEPAVNLRTCEHIPSGVYKVAWKQNNWRLVPVQVNTDELYQFSEDYTTKLIEEADIFWKKADIYKQYNLSHKRGLLLCGAPGCGKTAIITLLMKQLINQDGLIFVVNNTRDFGHLCDTINSVIRNIEKTRPIITIIEDVDQLISDYGGNDSELLDFLDGKNSVEHHLIILTSNDTTELSEALLRPSRIDMLIEIPNPSDNIRKEFFQKKGIEDSDLDKYVKATENMSFAQLKEVFIGAKILGKDLDKVVDQINTPFECKDYLNKNSEEIEGI